MADATVGKVCPKCSYIRTAHETAPDWQCPGCGVAYAKAGGAAASASATAPQGYAPARSAAPSGPIEAVIAALKGYVDFAGRATRTEYWWYLLFWFIVVGATGAIKETLGSVVVLALLLPSLTVGIRRLHDIGKSGWWVLIGFVPLIGPLILLYFAVQPSEGDNDYGPAPA
jgi:uncharacterized membrane protein YhaH (DUF805 family)